MRNVQYKIFWNLVKINELWTAAYSTLRTTIHIKEFISYLLLL